MHSYYSGLGGSQSGSIPRDSYSLLRVRRRILSSPFESRGDMRSKLSTHDPIPGMRLIPARSANPSKPSCLGRDPGMILSPFSVLNNYGPAHSFRSSWCMDISPRGIAEDIGLALKRKIGCWLSLEFTFISLVSIRRVCHLGFLNFPGKLICFHVMST